MNEQEIKEEFERVWKKLSEIESKIKSSVEKPNIFAQISSQKKVSMKEFIIQKSPKDDIQRTTCIAFYLEKFENKEEFSTKDIAEGFRFAKLTTPSNVSDKMQQAIRKAWIAPSKDKGNFYLTSTGEQAVNSNFEK